MIQLHSYSGPLWVNPSAVAVVEKSRSDDEKIKSWVWMIGRDGPHCFVETVDEVLSLLSGEDEHQVWTYSYECNWIKGNPVRECRCGKHVGWKAPTP
jgi:hypothetical protein